MSDLCNINAPKKKLCIFERKPILTIVLAIIIFLFSILFVKWIVYRASIPSKIVYFEESFNQGMDDCKVLDGTWKAKDGNEKGIIQLSKNKYATPYIEKSIPGSQDLPQSFVWKIRLKVSSFNGEAVTLGTLILPTGQITLVMNQNNQIGASYNLFDKPTYGQGVFSRISRNKWYDIYVLVDSNNKKIIVYANDNQILTKSYKASNPSVQEIWLGAIWLEGGGHYGAPVDISYSAVNLGNKGVLPKLSFIKYTVNIIRTIFN